MVSISNLEQSGRIADNVGKLEDVGTELLLHVTQEKHRIIDGEPANSCHCKNQVTEQNKLCPHTLRYKSASSGTVLGMIGH